MSRFIILSPSGQVLSGDTLYGVVFSSAAVRPNFVDRCVQMQGGQNDSIIFGHDYDHIELQREMASRALALLRRRGYALYELRDAV